MGLGNDPIKQWVQDLFADGPEMLNMGEGLL